MKVDVLSGASRSEGGLFYSVRWLSQAMIKAGMDVRLVSHIDTFTQSDLDVWKPVPVELYPAHGPLLSSFRLRRILAASRADLLHVHGIWLDRQWAAHQWQKKTGKPVVISPRGMLDPWAVRNSAWKKKLAGALFANDSLRSAACIHALCEAEVDAIRKYGLETPVAMIPNAVDLPRLGGLKGNAGRDRKLLFLGRIHPKKGLKELIEAWTRIQSHAHDTPRAWQLLIAGWDDGGHEEGLKKLAADLGVAGSIVFLGSRFGNEKDELLRSVDAFVLPSFSEGLPMSVLEAWSYNLPVVMTDFCNIPAGFDAGAAIRVEPETESVIQGLEHLFNLTDPEREAMGSRGRALVEQHFTWERVAADMIDVYRWCLGGDRPACIRTI